MGRGSKAAAAGQQKAKAPQQSAGGPPASEQQLAAQDIGATAGAAAAASPGEVGAAASAAGAAGRAAELRARGTEDFKAGRLEQALALYEQASELLPEDAALWLNRSIAERRLERWPDAGRHAERALELEPANVKAHYSRALCQQHAGQLQLALQACKDGLKVEAGNAALRQLHDEIKAQWVEQMRAAKAAQVQPAAGAKCPTSELSGAELKQIREKAKASMYVWQGRNPSQPERQALVLMITEDFRKKYEDLRSERESLAAKKGSTLQLDQYDKEQKLGLQLKGGHQPLPRPENVDLPESYKRPLGVISLDQLKVHGCDNPDRRYLMSVYGNVFDVSDRPDKYGPEGPYTILCGADITWGLFAGVDSVDYINRCYDLFKAKDMGKDKMAGVCSWLAWYWTEYGDPVGRLDLYQNEADLPPPPLEEVDGSCSVM